VEDTDRLTIGQLATAAGMTTKALRHYDRVGIFRPDEVDEETGYRWYRADRLSQARLLAALRGVGVPLEEVARCLDEEAGDDEQVDAVLEQHRRRLEARLTRVRGDLHRLAHLQRDGIPDGHDAPIELPSPRPTAEASTAAGDERRLAADLFNGVWTLMETEDRTPAQDDRMLHMAHASRYHWEQVGTAQNLARGEWLCSRVYAVLGRGEPALHHATRVRELCEEHGIGDWDLAFAHEALARAHAVAGHLQAAGKALDDARGAAEQITTDEDRDLLLADLTTIPGVHAEVTPAQPPAR
jgi:DNA-binding transcriptional MerR regulator